MSRVFARTQRLLPHSLWTGLILVLLLMLTTGSSQAFSLAPHPADNPASVSPQTDSDTAQAVLQSALRHAQEAKNYEIQVSVDQTITPERTFFSAATAETAHFEINGQISGPKQARLTIEAGRASFGMIPQEPQELLISGNTVYHRQDGRWVRVDTAPPTLGIGDQGFSLVEAATDATFIDATDGPPGMESLMAEYRRIGFTLRPEDVRRQLLAQQGPMSQEASVLAELQMPAIGGRGEIWVAPSGYPARLILHLSWVRVDEEPLHVAVTSETAYLGFDHNLPAQHFNPERAPEDGAPLPDLAYLNWLRPTLMGMVVLGVLGFFWILNRARTGARRALQGVTILLIMALLVPYTAPAIEAAATPQGRANLVGDTSASQREVRSIAEQGREVIVNAASGLDALADEDGDTLPNGYELTLGTNPFTPDTDFDGLTDAEEVKGILCAGRQLYSDPLNPDSNYDGLNDGNEFWRGECYKGDSNGWIWDDDNDDDKVPDGLDLSPFSNSLVEGHKGGPYDGANFTFESLDMDADPNKTVIYPFYVEVQVRPTNPNSLRWAYKTLYWPGDTKGAIQNTDPVVRFISELKGAPIGSSGKLTLAPFLSATVRESDLPSLSTRNLYGVSYNPKKDDDGNPVLENGEQLYELNVPLMPVERGGQVYAFQARMIHDQNGNTNLERNWKNLRLKWAVIGDVLMPDDDGKAVPSPNGGYGLVVYDESYYITGLQVSRQGGAAIMVASALPKEGVPYDDSPTTLLRAGLEARFLPGDLSMAEIKQRFNSPSNATLEERWGIPHEQGFRVLYDGSMHYQHVDQALATTTMTTTRQLLEKEFFGYSDNVSLIFGSEQRTSTVNLDDDPTANYKTITLNTCLKPLITSRTLKLQTYKYVVEGDDFIGNWQPMDLEEILADIEAIYADSTDPNYEYYEEELTILRMAITAWNIGQTSILKIGQFDLASYYDGMQLNDALILKYLTEQDVLPKGAISAIMVVLGVFEKGAVEWLEEKFTKITKFIDSADKFFMGSHKPYGPPDSYIKVIPMPGENGQPAPSEPIITLDSLLEYTDTAVTVITILVTILDFFYEKEIGKALEVIIKVVKIVKNIHDIIATVKFAVDMVGKSAEAVAQAISASKEISALSKPFAAIGLVLAIGTIWALVAVQIGTVGASIAVALVLKAIVETVLIVVLFVIGSIYPFGTIVALAIGLIRLIESLIGVTFDPLSLLIDFLFGVNVYERVEIVGDIKMGEFNLEPRELGAGVISGRTFRMNLPNQITLGTVNDGTKANLEQAHAQVHIGRISDGKEYTFCTKNKELLEDYKKALDGFITGTFQSTCIYYRVPSAFPNLTPGGTVSMSSPQKMGNVWRRTLDAISWVDVKPGAAVNGRILLDVSVDVKIPYDECTVATGCDHYVAESSSPPSIIEFYMDILPSTLSGIWNWNKISNYDPDGDGLYGYEAYDGFWVGPDANLCPNINSNSALQWDTDGDGLSDKFELETSGFDPCKADTDGDGLKDGEELMIGTKPDQKDTDNDGLTDREETAYSNGFFMVFPWTVQMNNEYPGLPNPHAFPNPRQANSDTDYRNDKQEKAKQSSPNSYNAIPVGDPLNLYIGQSQQQGGVNGITIGTAGWQNVETAGIEPTLTVTLPVAFSNVTTSAKVQPPIWWFDANEGTPLPTGNPNVYRWKLPMLTLNRFASIKITGLPSIPSGPVSITAQLVYTEGAKLQIVTAETPLWVNEGGPRVEIVGVTGGVLLDNGVAAAGAQASLYASNNTPVIVQGTAEDPERVDKVFVCLVASGPCAAGDWKEANGRDTWSYSFDAPADGIYIVRAYGVDTLGAVGEADEESVGVDTSAPDGLTLDLEGTVYLHTESAAIAARSDTAVAVGEPPFVILSGQVSDQAGAAFVSGLDKIGVLVNDEQYHTVDVETPGAQSSAFHFKWTLPNSYGSSVRNGQGQYEITVAAQDKAGNTGATDTLTVIVDDTPPTVHTALPQISTATTFQISGRADDTALVKDRQPMPTFAKNLTLANSATQFTTGVGKAVIVGDVNGDTIDDVLLLVPTSGVTALPLQAGIFFGKPGGLPSSLAVANADVKLPGEGNTGLVADGAAAGDVNGDGVGDFLVGDPGRDTAYLILGRRSGWPTTLNLANADWKLTQAGSTGFGGSVAGAGDVDGDGLADILVGATNKGAINGPAWLYLGREQGTPSAVRMFYMSRAAAGAPRLAGLGDASGDGLSDFLMAAQGMPVALVAGRAPGDWPAGDINLITAATAQFSGNGNGLTVAAAGDVNGDGLRDLLVGDPNAASPMLYLIHGRRNFAGSATLASAAAASFQPGTAPNSRLGAGMASLGDVDKDGRADFTFGQPGNGSGPNRAAVIMTKGTVLAPNLSVDATAASLIGGNAANQQVGGYVTAGDVTGDGIVDILVGAGGEGKAYLFAGAFDPGGVAGIKNVEIGFAGPNISSATPVSATLPAAWQTATLGNGSGGISAWLGQLTVPGNGDYRIYVRTTDKADNRRDEITWYVGNVWVNAAPVAFNGSTATMNAPSLVNKSDLSLAGAINSSQTPQMVRIYDGYRWQRIQPATGNWSLQSTIPLHDLYTDVFRVVARDAVGNQIHATRTLAVDTLVTAPVISTTMPVNLWQTDSPSLTLNWSAITDGSGVAATWAAVNTDSDATPTTPAVGNQLVTPLNAAGSYYGHLRVRDNAGNEAITRIGPFLVNRTQTPSVILADGVMDTAGGEYTAGTLLNYDPYAAFKPAALWGTWDANQVYLGFPGYPWGTMNKLAIYLDTKNGGLSQGLDLFGNVHTLPIAADYALIVGDKPETPSTLYKIEGGAWSPVADAQSFAALGTDTEIVLNRAEIEAVGGLGLLAYAENAEGVWAVLPGGARPNTESILTDRLSFGEKLAWASLGNRMQPAAGQAQVHAPVITVLPAVQNLLAGGQATSFQTLIHNPDVGTYANVPVSITVDAPMQLTGVSGATCSNCPAGGRTWEVLANVAAGGTQTVTVNAQMGGADLRGLFPIGVNSRMIGSGLTSQPQLPASGHYLLDQGVTTMKIVGNDSIQYRQPGQVAFPVLVDLDLTQMGRCLTQVEVNTGGGWQPLCSLGLCEVIVANVPVGAIQDWQIRTQGRNGQVSRIETIQVIADNTRPTVEIANTAVLSGSISFLEGLTWDNFPTTRAPQRVEVSLNGGRFLTASVSKQKRTLQRNGAETETAVWRLPIQFDAWDGQTIEVVARAIDEAGNVSEASRPMSVILDGVGPTIAVSQTADSLIGTVTDGSGVATVEVSLDGGNSYQPMEHREKEVRFDLARWRGGPIQPMAMIRAADTYGNMSMAVTPVSTQSFSSVKLFLPSIQQDAGTRENAESASAGEAVDASADTSTAAPVEPATGSWQLFLPSVGGTSTTPTPAGDEVSAELPPAEAGTQN